MRRFKEQRRGRLERGWCLYLCISSPVKSTSSIHARKKYKEKTPILSIPFPAKNCSNLAFKFNLANVSNTQPEYLTMKEGDPCVKGKMYKISCNTCHCADNNALYCTKMACLENEDIKRFSLINKRSPQGELRSGDNEKDKIYLPNLPEGRCVPGRLYSKECQKCYCDHSGKSVCNPSKPTKCKEPLKSKLLNRNFYLKFFLKY